MNGSDIVRIGVFFYNRDMRPIFSIHKDDVSLILYVIGGLLVARAFMLAAGLPGYLPYIDDILSIIMNYVMSIGDGIRSRVWG